MNSHSICVFLFTFDSYHHMKSLNKHTKIINAATKVFAKKGFFNARISDIAKEAKVADGTIYLYFNNKFDILISVFDEEISNLINQINKLLAKEEDPKKMLAIFINKHLSMMKKNRNLAEVIQIELRQSAKIIKNFRNTRFNDYLDIIASIITLGQKEGIYRTDIDPEIAKRVVFGALDETARIWSTPSSNKPSAEEMADQLTNFFLFGLLYP